MHAHDSLKTTLRTLSVAAAVAALAACSRPSADPATASASAASTPTTPAATTADIGKPAPDFTLKDLDGRDVHLASFRGKVVVLEWFNPGCPFVNRSHDVGSLKGLAKRHEAEGVVWLAVNSSAAGKQGAGIDANRDGAKKFGVDHPILLDETGAVGKMYGATNTPNMFVIDKTGTLAYAGAIDNSPDAEGQSPTGGKLINYVDAALADLAAGRPVATPKTVPYGCGVKYGS
jgi:peroxiredoxin